MGSLQSKLPTSHNRGGVPHSASVVPVSHGYWLRTTEKKKRNLMRKLGEATRIPGRLENQSGIKEQGGLGQGHAKGCLLKVFLTLRKL